MTYPKIKEAYFDYQQRKLLETLTQSWEKLDEYDDIEQNPEEENLPIVGENKTEKDNEYLAEYVETQIEKIDLEMPILKGATKTNLGYML